MVIMTERKGPADMTLKYNDIENVWEFFNGAETIRLSAVQISFLSHEFERHGWEYGIEDEIDLCSDSIDFSEISREEFVDMCMDEMQSKWEIGYLNTEPDYEQVVFGVAEENGIWRD